LLTKILRIFGSRKYHSKKDIRPFYEELERKARFPARKAGNALKTGGEDSGAFFRQGRSRGLLPGVSFLPPAARFGGRNG
jgi:hypothetical protein